MTIRVSTLKNREVRLRVMTRRHSTLLHQSLNALVITVFGQMEKRMSGFRLLRMALLQHAVGQAEKADGSCTVFPAGLQRMERD